MKIESDGFYKVRSNGKGITDILISGSGGTCSLVYVDDYGTEIALVDGALTLGEQYRVQHGTETPVYLKVVGANNISVFFNGEG